MNMIKKIIVELGAHIINVIRFSGFAILIFLETLLYLKNAIKRRQDIFKQLYNASVNTLPVVSIVALFTGMILTLQTGIGLKQYNIEEMIGNIVIATLTREMAPFTAAIILIAAVGSTMAAEVGTMKVSEEIDALEVMSISPVDFLVMPRIVALSLAMPVAAIYICVLGVIGGSVVAQSHLNISFDTFYVHILQSLLFKPVYVGIFKAFMFGIIASTISCANGLRARNGAIGVGKATRDSVVASFLMVLIVGYYITEVFFGGDLQ